MLAIDFLEKRLERLDGELESATGQRDWHQGEVSKLSAVREDVLAELEQIKVALNVEE